MPMYLPPVAPGADLAVALMRSALVVEDEPPVREASAQVLRKLGLCVVEPTDGEAAMCFIRRGLPIDLLFTTSSCRRRAGARTGYPGNAQQDAVFQRAQLLPKPYRLDGMSRAMPGNQVCSRAASAFPGRPKQKTPPEITRVGFRL